MQWGQRVALRETVSVQNGHGAVSGVGGAGFACSLLTAFTSTNTATATSTKVSTALRKSP